MKEILISYSEILLYSWYFKWRAFSSLYLMDEILMGIIKQEFCSYVVPFKTMGRILTGFMFKVCKLKFNNLFSVKMEFSECKYLA